MPRVSVAALVLLTLLASGCSVTPGQPGGRPSGTPWPAGIPARIELADTPFFPQRDYQCGPAALATLLGASGVEAPPDRLVGEVYLPARKGSLQTELLAATRQRHRIPYLIEAQFGSLVQQLADGRPVLVLLNLGVQSWPIWHYAVVIGYERDAGRLLLRSGTTPRARMSLRRFGGAWSRAGRWGFVALRAGDVPRAAHAARYAAAVADFERVDGSAALRAYRAGIERWPDEPLLRLGEANMLLALGDRAGAEEALRELLRRSPGDAAARNNFADLLSQRGCREAALAEIALAGDYARGTPLAAAIEATAGEIAARPADPVAQCPRADLPSRRAPSNR